MSFGILQSFIILRIFSVGEWGIVQLAVSIGTALGIYQHLGLASASNREIAAAEKKNDIFKIFITTVSIRYLVTIPLSVGLFLAAPAISKTYGFEEILIPLRLYSVVLLFQGMQAILNSVISGTQRFKELFIFQGAIALSSVIIYIPMVYFLGIRGFFYAMIIQEAVKSTALFVIALRPYLKNAKFPSKKEFVAIFKSLFTLGMSIYFVKILVINWEKVGANLLGFTQNAEIVGFFAFALMYAKKLMNVSDAVTDVNLPVFSEKYVKDFDNFKSLFVQNFNRVFSLVVFFAMSAVYWAPQLIAVLIGSNKYDTSLPLLLPMVFAYIFFSLNDVIQSSVTIPAKMVKEMVLGYALLLAGTVCAFFIGREYYDVLPVMAYSMLFGAVLSFFYLSFLLQKKMSFKFVDHSHILLVIQAVVVSTLSGLPNIYLKLASYFIFVSLYIWGLNIAGFATKKDLLSILGKLRKFFKK